MNDLVFATMAASTATARDALLWVRSIRAFGGRYGDAPIWLMIPKRIERLPATLPAFKAFYEQDFLYRLFIHQAVLAGTVLAETGHQEPFELPYLVNYPLHMHASYPESHRPEKLNEVISFRYDTLANEPHWEETIQIDEPLQSWLYEQQKDLNLI